MKKYKLKLVTLFWLLFSVNLYSQHISDLRINEMLINNTENFDDEYGRHVPWIEIFNTAYNNVNIGECYLTNDTAGLANGSGVKKWYRIPKGDPKTLIHQRGFVIFYMDNAPLYGTFHVNFDPRMEGTSNYVALISSNGKTLIDIFEFPDSLRHSKHSYGYFDDGVKEAENEKGEMISNKGFFFFFIPGSTNKVFDGLTKSEQVGKDDRYGIGLAVISMFVVFSVLIIIYLIVKVFALTGRKKMQKQKTVKQETVIQQSTFDEDITSEEIAAAIMALHLYVKEPHDPESEVITIETPSAHYSPWGQKHLVIKRVQRKR
jgi:hypothetical protein